MESKRFLKNDSGFVCAHCGRQVPPLRYSSRNHCCHCLWSVHLDENPGDRASSCGGLMEPVAAAPDARRGMVIYHRCGKCGAVRRVKAARDDPMPLLIRLTGQAAPDT